MRHSVGPRRRSLLSLLRLAVLDCLEDWRLSIVMALGVAVALAPLSVLYGLKLGMIETLRDNITSDPANLELVLRGGGSASFDGAWFDRMRERPEVGFLAPMTRGTVATIILRTMGEGRVQSTEVSLIPTADGDPVLAKAGLATPANQGLVLTYRAAEKLGVRVDGNADLLGIVTRSDGGRREHEQIALNVSGVLPLELSRRVAAFVPSSFIIAIEDYREWQRVPAYGWPGRTPVDDPFADFRLYAKDIDSVEPLRGALTAEGHNIESAADMIARVRRIDGDLDVIFSIVLGLTLVGFSLTIALNQVAAVARKRGSLAVLQLIGYRRSQLMAFPMAQAGLLALIGAASALAMFAALDPMLALLFADIVETHGSITRFPAGAAVGMLIASMLIAVLASSFAAREVSRVALSEELRHA